jgi:hypothetical protein
MNNSYFLLASSSSYSTLMAETSTKNTKLLLLWILFLGAGIYIHTHTIIYGRFYIKV